MKYFIPIYLPQPPVQINAADQIFLLGSCFTEHMGNRLEKYGWNVCENPSGIVFNPNSIYKTIKRVVEHQSVQPEELIEQDGLWHHWDFHSRMSHIYPNEAVRFMNESIHNAHHFIQQADWVLITLGTAYQYFYKKHNYGVSNCHRVPATQFEKKLLDIEEIVFSIQDSIQLVRQINQKANFLLTISPVRHIKDGVVENNRSKARLIEAVHQCCNNQDVIYFPAYELLIDVLRDYRFYDADLVHPNYAATQSVWEFFTKHFMTASAQIFLSEMIGINDAYQHRSRFPESPAHQQFLATSLKKLEKMKQKYPHLKYEQFEHYFKTGEN